MIAMRAAIYALALFAALAIPAAAQTRIDAIKTAFRWFGPNDRIIVERYDDPKVANVSCYMSRADTGGIKGGFGLAEDPSRFSLACRAVGPVVIPSGLRRIPRYEGLWTLPVAAPWPRLRPSLLSIAVAGESLILGCHRQWLHSCLCSKAIMPSSIAWRAEDQQDGGSTSSASILQR